MDPTESNNSSYTTTQNKTDISAVIKAWIRNDREMAQLRAAMAHRRAQQKRITAELVAFARENDIADADVEYIQEVRRKPISKKNLVPILVRFFRGDSAKASELSEFIYENRESVVCEKIVGRASTSVGAAAIAALSSESAV
jgi:septal ring factor EnvC (AmiA/AmiB activator)